MADHAIDLVFTAGPLMGHLFEALPVSRRGIAAATSAGLIDPLARILRPATP